MSSDANIPENEPEIPLILGASIKETDELDAYKNLDADKILAAYGNWGFYQLLSCFIVSLSSTVYAISMMTMSFLSLEPEFSCTIPNNTLNFKTSAHDKCSLYNELNETSSCFNIPGAFYNYSIDKSANLVTEFDFVCKDAGFAEHGSSAFLVGGLFAAPAMTRVSDMFGRRTAFIYPFFLAVFLNFLIPFSPNFYVFLGIRIMCGFLICGFCHTASTVCSEYVDRKARTYVPVFAIITWVIGYISVGVLQLYFTSWRTLYFILCIPGLLFCPIIWFTPESIHWLIQQKKYKEIKKYILTASKINKMQLDLEECRSDNKNNVKELSLFKVLKNPGILFQLFLNGFTLMTMNATYWALSLFSAELSSDHFTGYTLSGLIELPSGLIALFLMHSFSRRTVGCSAFLAQGVIILAACLLPQTELVNIWLSIFAKGFNCVSWAVQPVVNTEIPPTQVRTSFSGFATLIGEFGSLAAPYSDRLKSLHPLAPYFVISATSFFAAVCVSLMPETKNEKLPDNMDEFDSGPLFRYLERRKARRNANSNEIEQDDAALELAENNNNNNEVVAPNRVIE